MKTFRSLLSALTLVSLTTGCLMTREDVSEEEEKKKMHSTVYDLQKKKADVDNRFDQIEEELRKINGRVEQAEHKGQSGNESQRSEFIAMNKKIEDVVGQLRILEERIAMNDKKIDFLEREWEQMRLGGSTKPERAPDPVAAKSDSKEALYRDGDDAIRAKEWSKAAALFEKFRKAHPKSPRVPSATLKIGISFQELGMKSEAKAFYDEVLERFPKDAAAKAAAQKLKQLKK
ncbi:MAG: tetratricopeptide repeat protein [Bdellovibrionales bacterium]|nr:tetratricopeptide repeat protein [Bdellovibrionales bacterium]